MTLLMTASYSNAGLLTIEINDKEFNVALHAIISNQKNKEKFIAEFQLQIGERIITPRTIKGI